MKLFLNIFSLRAHLSVVHTVRKHHRFLCLTYILLRLVQVLPIGEYAPVLDVGQYVIEYLFGISA